MHYEVTPLFALALDLVGKPNVFPKNDIDEGGFVFFTITNENTHILHMYMHRPTKAQPTRIGWYFHAWFFNQFIIFSVLTVSILGKLLKNFDL